MCIHIVLSLFVNCLFFLKIVGVGFGVEIQNLEIVDCRGGGGGKTKGKKRGRGLRGGGGGGGAGSPL